MSTKIENKGLHILDSFDNMNQVDSPLYFYTRLLARMQNDLHQKRKPFFYLKPAFMTISLSCILIINVLFFFNINSKKAVLAKDQTSSEATIESFSNSYDLATTSVYE